MRSLTILVFLAIHLRGTIADGNDWINPEFALKKTGAPDAQKRIISFAGSTAKDGPWTVYGDAKVLPPDGQKTDYYSWAPYHWPECNFCQSGRTHLTTGGSRANGTNTTDSTSDGDLGPYEDGGGDETDDDNDEENSTNSNEDGIIDDGPPTVTTRLPISHRRMVRRIKEFSHYSFVHRRQQGILPSDPFLPGNPLVDSSSTTTDKIASGTAGAAENARKTKTSQGKEPTKTNAGGSDCTPSPTKSLPPSYTWTSCKYVVRDGKLNPDVRELPGVNNIVDVTQSVLYNALAPVLSGPQSGSQTAISFIDKFFLDPSTGMQPRVRYGQMIRGPDQKDGQYIGVIDLRGIVKLVNAVQVMRASKAPAWTSDYDSRMKNWAKQYVQWLHTDPLGQKALSAPNNHGSFATNQLASVNILVDDTSAAAAALKSYFSNQFQDQIAASGEQPFEAVRTRPFHYRCFNLEAMITNAKLGDQLGLDFWSAKSKYGATIQNALDFVMTKGPGKEDITDIFPHIAAIAIAYGDPTGRYTAYLKKNDKRYQEAPYYYYNQAGALTKAPTSKNKVAEDPLDGLAHLAETDVPTPTSVPQATPTIPWECPTAFATATEVQLDDGVFVTCDELKHFYGYAMDTVNGSS